MRSKNNVIVRPYSGSLLMLVFSCFLLMHMKALGRPTRLDFARASEAVYGEEAFVGHTISPHDTGVFLLNFHGNTNKDEAFKLTTYVNEQSKEAIIAIRGTDNSTWTKAYNNWKFNIGEISQGGFQGKVSEKMVTHGALAMAYGCFDAGTSHLFAASTSASCVSLMSAAREQDVDLTLGAIRLVVNKSRKIYGADKTYVTGHSMGGFLAQLFAVLCDVEGTSFDAPGLGFYRSGEFEKTFSMRKRVYNAEGKIFENHRLDGDVVSLVNTADDQRHFGQPMITHRHNFWNLWELANAPKYLLKFHDISLLVAHLEAHEPCRTDFVQECSEVDNRPNWRRDAANLLAIQAASMIGLR